jgi:hypothetical protein
VKNSERVRPIKFQNRRSQQQQQREREREREIYIWKQKLAKRATYTTVNLVATRAEKEQGHHRKRLPPPSSHPAAVTMRGARAARRIKIRLVIFSPAVFLSTTRASDSIGAARLGLHWVGLGLSASIGAACSCHRARRLARSDTHTRGGRPPAVSASFCMPSPLDSSCLQLFHRQRTSSFSKIEIRLPDNFVDYLRLGYIVRSPMQCKQIHYVCICW